MLNLLTSSIALALAYLTIVATLAIVAALRAGGRREDANEEQDALAVSRFTIPVSIIVPISNGTAAINQTLTALLDLNYPEFEVIAVADGTPQTVLDELTREWQLDAREFFYRKIINTSEVRRIYRSGRDPRLMLIDKKAARSASAFATASAKNYTDALNCGVNVARYRYFMPIEPGVAFDRDALLRVMASALRDPASVIGASNHVERGTVVEGNRARMTALFQRLGSARSLMDSRLAWRHLSAGLGPAGGVMVWRRDSVIKAQGFSAAAADPDIDLMVRLQTNGVEGSGRFDRGVEVFGRAGSQTLRSALVMSGRRQRAALEVVRVMVKGRAHGLGMKTLAHFIESEIVTPVAQLWIVLATVIGAAAGWFPWTSVFLAFALLAFGNAAVSTAALLLRGSSAGAPEEPELKRLVLAGPFEFLFYRPILAAARLAAAFSFVVR